MSWHRKQRAVTMIEVMVSMMLILVALGTLLTAAMLANRSAEKSRSRVLAEQLAGTVVEEIRDHKYGSSRPFPGWTRTESGSFKMDMSLQAFEGGQKVETKLAAEVKTPSEGNGSFFGRAKESSDLVQIDVTWREKNKTQKIETQIAVGR